MAGQLLSAYEDKEAKEIAAILSEHRRGKHKIEKIERAMFRISSYLRKRKISSFTRSFLNNAILIYTDVCERSKRELAKEITKRLKSTEVVRTKRYLVDKGVDRIWEPRNKIETVYYFEDEN